MWDTHVENFLHLVRLFDQGRGARKAMFVHIRRRWCFHKMTYADDRPNLLVCRDVNTASIRSDHFDH
jgi:hypothetical protein